MTKQRGWAIGGTLLLLLVVVGFLLTLSPQAQSFLLRRDPVWQTMQRDGVWRVGMDPSFPPFEWLDANGQPTGYDVALAERMAAAWSLRLEIVPIGFDSLIDAVQTGRVDSVISALPFDERLTEDLAYSIPYFDAGIVLAVHRDRALPSVDQLTNQRSGVEWGSMADMVGRRLQRTAPDLQLIPFETATAAVAALVAGEAVDALLVDNVTLRVNQVAGAPLVAVGNTLESNPYVIGMGRNAFELQQRVQTTLTTLQESGTLKELEAQWLVEVTPP